MLVEKGGRRARALLDRQVAASASTAKGGRRAWALLNRQGSNEAKVTEHVLNRELAVVGVTTIDQEAVVNRSIMA